MPMAVIAAARGQDYESPGDVRQFVNEGSAKILRTTQITTQEGPVEPVAFCHQYRKQHPWVGKDGC